MMRKLLRIENRETGSMRHSVKVWRFPPRTGKKPGHAECRAWTPSQEAVMLKKIALVAAILVVLAAGTVTAADKSKDYVNVFTSDPRTFNYLESQRQTTSMHTTNFVDGLIEHDKYGILRPALAESWSANADTTVWTFNIRKGVKWVTGDLEVYAEVKAKDWVDAMKFMLDKKSTLTYLIAGFIKNADKYLAGTITDFSQVGVKAKGDYVLEYTMDKPTPYFETLLTYNPYCPVNGEFLAAKDKDFGKVEKNGILYNGAYVLSNFTSKSVLEYDANPSYWDKARVTIQHVKLVFDDGKDPDSRFNNFDAGTYSSAPVYTDNEAPITSSGPGRIPLPSSMHSIMTATPSPLRPTPPRARRRRMRRRSPTPRPPFSTETSARLFSLAWTGRPFSRSATAK
jgi:ABC-type oligopeptide transport system substrate-binding subunit